MHTTSHALWTALVCLAIVARADEFRLDSRATQPLATTQGPFEAVMLSDGRISEGYMLLTGGFKDPATGVFSSAEFAFYQNVNFQLTAPRHHHSATLLKSGGVLIAGGTSASNGSTLAYAELYLPSDTVIFGRWQITGTMNTPRSHHTSITLEDGRVLVAGGLNALHEPLASCEIYDPVTQSWSVTGSLSVGAAIAGSGEAVLERGRSNAAAILLSNGQVLLVGGTVDKGSTTTALNSVERFTPATGTWTRSAPMNRPRFAPQLTPLRGDRILVTGRTQGDSGPGTTTAEIYDPFQDRWTQTTPMVRTPPNGPIAAGVLSDGRVLVAGGAGKGAELYDPTTGNWTAAADMQVARDGDTLRFTNLRGQVEVFGGAPAALPEYYIPDHPPLITLKWSSGTGKIQLSVDNFSPVACTVEYKERLTDPEWIPAAFFPGNSFFNQFTEEAHTSRFYRARPLQ